MDKEKYTGLQIQENYQYLIDKWGEWQIGGDGINSIVIRYVDVGNALFSGLMIVYCILSGVSLLLSIVLGKIVFPVLGKHYADCNEEMVDLATLKSASQIDEMSNARKNSNDTGGWF